MMINGAIFLNLSFQLILMNDCYWRDCGKSAKYKLKGDFGIEYCPYHAIYISILLGDYRKAFGIYSVEKAILENKEKLNENKGH